MKTPVSSSTSRVIAVNKKARHDFFIEQKLEAGIVLMGWEVKSLRAGRLQLSDSHIILRRGEAWLLGAHIPPLPSASTHVETDPSRTRKLLLKSDELKKLIGHVERLGYTLIPLSMYWKNGKVKVDVALAKGKKTHDKRETLKQRDWQREQARVLKRKR